MTPCASPMCMNATNSHVNVANLRLRAVASQFSIDEAGYTSRNSLQDRAFSSGLQSDRLQVGRLFDGLLLWDQPARHPGLSNLGTQLPALVEYRPKVGRTMSAHAFHAHLALHLEDELAAGSICRDPWCEVRCFEILSCKTPKKKLFSTFLTPHEGVRRKREALLLFCWLCGCDGWALEGWEFRAFWWVGALSWKRLNTWSSAEHGWSSGRALSRVPTHRRGSAEDMCFWLLCFWKATKNFGGRLMLALGNHEKKTSFVKFPPQQGAFRSIVDPPPRDMGWFFLRLASNFGQFLGGL